MSDSDFWITYYGIRTEELIEFPRKHMTNFAIIVPQQTYVPGDLYFGPKPVARCETDGLIQPASIPNRRR